MRILDLPLKKEWYNMIESGIKTEEYREIKPYWGQRFIARANPKPYFASSFDPDIFPLRDIYLHPQSWHLVFKQYTHVRFRYGYTSRTMLREIESITIGYGKPEWGAPTDKQVFIIKLGKAKRHDENYQVKHREPKPKPKPKARKKRVANGQGDRSEYMRQYWQRQKERLAEKNRADYIRRKLEFVPGLATKNDKPAKAERMCEKCKNYPCFAGIESLESDFANEGCHAFRKRENNDGTSRTF